MTEIFLIEVEGYYVGFIVIDIRKTDYGKLKLSQTGIIDRILDALGMNYETTNICSEPADTNKISKDDNGDPRK